jgi:hypothetical protein
MFQDVLMPVVLKFNLKVNNLGYELLGYNTVWF